MLHEMVPHRNLGKNKLVGTVPDSWSELYNLNILWVCTSLSKQSALSRMVCNWVVMLVMMMEMMVMIMKIYENYRNLEHNALTGTLPKSWSNMKSLADM